MLIFTIYNPTTKQIAEELEFSSYIEANTYCKANYPAGYVAEHDPFHFTSNFRKMLNQGMHERVHANPFGLHSSIEMEDGTMVHVGSLTMDEYDYLRKANIPMKQISKTEFIKLHNSLIK